MVVLVKWMRWCGNHNHDVKSSINYPSCVGPGAAGCGAAENKLDKLMGQFVCLHPVSRIALWARR